MKLKKIGNDLKFIFDSEESNSTIAVKDYDYNLRTPSLLLLIYDSFLAEKRFNNPVLALNCVTHEVSQFC